MNLIPMTSLELDDEDKLDYPSPVAMPMRPDYPPGCRICLCDEEIEKLGIDPTDACVDGTFVMQAIGKITSISCNDSPDGKKWRIECQLTDMGILGADDGGGDEAGKKEEPKAGVGEMVGVY